MSEIPTPSGEPDEVDERYRRLSDRDPTRPSEGVRRAVLRHAAELAAHVQNEEKSPAVHRPAAKHAPWRVASYAGLAAAAALAGLLIAPHFLTPSPAPMARQSLGAPSRPPADVVAPVPVAPAPPPAADQAADAEPSTERSEVAQDRLARAMSAPQTHVAASAAAAGSPRALSSPRAAAVADSATALRDAARRGDVSTLQRLLADKLNIDARDAAGRTALMVAVRAGQQQAVTTLLAAGADPNAADASGATPLQVALANADSAIATALEQAGAR